MHPSPPGQRLTPAGILRAAAVVLCAGVLAVGCTPTPTPTPTPTGFANEAEAFAAAEATYRAYVDALNQVDLADPTTFEEVYRWTTGDANAEARRSFSQMHADGWSVSGETKFDSLSIESDQPEGGLIVALCLDVTSVDVLDESGVSVVPAARVDRQSLDVEMELAATSTGLAIARSNAVEPGACSP